MKKLLLLFQAAALLLFVTIFFNTAQAKTLKIATLSPEGSDWMQKMRAGAKEIKQKTSGRVKFKFYPGGVMGDDSAVLRKIRIGQLKGGALPGGSLLKANPNYQIYSLLLSYKNQGEIDYVRQHIDSEIKKGFEKGGFVIIGMAESGFAYAMSSKQAISNITQLRQQKVWIPTNDINFQKILKSFGVTAIPLPYGDVLAGLQTGLINTVAMSPIGAIALQWYTQINYIIDMPLLYSLGILTIDKKSFSKIKPADQKIIMDVMNKAFKKINAQNKKHNKESLEVLAANGIEFIKPSETELKEWQEYADKANQKMVDTGTLDPKLVEKVKKLLSEYRSSKHK
ncbi:MAG: TRAP transporter substrate-binding protein DctP [Proteobacteria bacterium]|nr:TRAP transporter substrate-binding protein DctP [Pseudomonadota bacterium]